MIRRWAVVLEGHQFDLQDALEMFEQGAIEVRTTLLPNGQTTPAVMSDELDEASSSTQAAAIARRLVALLNGALFVARPSRQPLSTGAILEEDGQGGWRQHQKVLLAQRAAVRTSLSAVVIRTDGRAQPMPIPPPPAHVTLLGLAAADETVADVFSFFSGEPSWFEVHKAIELMRDDLNKKRGRSGQVGNHDHSAIGWNHKLEREITRAANVHRHSRVRWNGDTPESVMSLDEARMGVRSLVEAWCKWRVSEGNA